jgi:hypothetical protein
MVIEFEILNDFEIVHGMKCVIVFIPAAVSDISCRARARARVRARSRSDDVKGFFRMSQPFFSKISANEVLLI